METEISLILFNMTWGEPQDCNKFNFFHEKLIVNILIQSNSVWLKMHPLQSRTIQISMNLRRFEYLTHPVLSNFFVCIFIQFNWKLLTGFQIAQYLTAKKLQEWKVSKSA